MRVLVYGCGSIGARHLRNLRTLGISALAIVEPVTARRDEISNETGAVGFSEVQSAWEWRPDVVVVASPSNSHVEIAQAAARRGCHLFIEKPLSHNEHGLQELGKEVQNRKLVSIVGCNMRFHPGPAQVKQLLRDSAVGKVLFAQVHTGSYLPEWRPTQDYRQSYSARSELGGGCILDCIHEIDLARWYCGGVRDVVCVAGHFSSLQIDVEDVAVLICRHLDGSMSEIHLDYVQRTYERGCRIVGENGTLFWDFQQGVVRWYNATDRKWQEFRQPEQRSINDMYLDEMRHFLRCVETGECTVCPVSEAIDVMAIALAAKRSAAQRSTVNTEEVWQ